MRRLTLLSLVLATVLSAKEYTYLNDNQQKIMKLKKTQIKASSATSKFSFVSPITLSASQSYNYGSSTELESATTKYGLSVTQTVFKFGGLVFAYMYADETEHLNLLNLELQNDTTYLGVIQTVVSIRLNKLSLEQTELNIENKKYEISQYKEKYRAGEVDVSLLNNAILALNTLQSTKVQLINSIKTSELELAKKVDVKEDEITLPTFEQIAKEKYVNNNYTLLTAKKQVDVNRFQHLATLSNYLPSVSLNGSYGIQSYDYDISEDDSVADYTEREYYSYGVTVSIPFDYANTFSTVQNTHVQSLQASLDAIESKKAVESDYETYLANLDYYAEKIKLHKQNVKMYEEMILLTKGEVDGGFALIDDLKTMQNSKRIEEINVKMNELNLLLERASAYYSVKE
jgi:outer membrane protein